MKIMFLWIAIDEYINFIQNKNYNYSKFSQLRGFSKVMQMSFYIFQFSKSKMVTPHAVFQESWNFKRIEGKLKMSSPQDDICNGIIFCYFAINFFYRYLYAILEIF